MSQKINSKTLHYDASLPPFLAALRSQASGHQGPDPLLSGQRRSAKKRSGSEEAEDAPLVVDEQGNTADYQVDKDGTVRHRDGGGDEEDDVDDKKNSEGKIEKREAEAKAAIGGRKRKVGKVVGEAAEEQSEKKREQAADKKEQGDAGSAVDKRVKKKAKKVKLSFDDEEG